MTVASLQPLARLRWDKPSGQSVLIALGIGILLHLAGVLLMALGMAADAPVKPGGLTGLMPAGVQVMLIAFVGPIVEEAFFRGWLPLKLSEIMPGAVATLCSATLFALGHTPSSPAVWLLFFSGSLMLNSLARRFDNLIVPTIAHWTINVMSVLG